MRKYSLLSISLVGVALLLLIGIASHFIWNNVSINEQLLSDNQGFEVTKLEGKEKYAYYKALYTKYKGWTKKDLKKIPKKDRPDLAALQDYLRTADPNTGDIPFDASIKANELTDVKVQEIRNNPNQRAITGVNWLERGPDDVGGRTRALMYDPNDATGKKVWAGGVGGGLWYTNDITVANPTWVAVDNFWENIAISSIAYDPSNTQIMYVATGEGWLNGGAQVGGGIWKTADGGTTWNRLASSTLAVSTEFAYLQKIVVTPTGRVLVACRNGGNGGIYSSTDGGANWVEVLDGEGGADIEIAANGDIYATTHFLKFAGLNTGQMHKSTNDGATWTNITPTIPSASSRIELACAPSDANIVYAVGSDGSNIAFFKKTTNGGTTWTDVTVPKYLNQNCTVSATDFTRGQSWYDLILTVNPTNSDHVVVGGIDVHRSTNGGASWTSISYWTGGCGEYVHADIHAFAYKPGSSDEMLVGSDGGISRSPNIQAATPSFSDRNSGYNVTQFYAVAMHPTDASNYFLAGAQDNGTRKLTSAGVGGSTQPTGGDGAFCFIDQDNPNIQISSYVFNSFYKSTNGGTSFSALGTQDQNTGEFINPADYHDDLDLLYSSSTGSRDVARWTVPAGGRSNFNVTGMAGNVMHLKASPFSAASTTLYIGTDAGEVVRVANANATGGTSKAGTILSNATMQAQGSVSSIEFGTSENEIIVTYSNYGAQNVWYTTNGGTNWTSKDNGHGLPNMPVRWAMFNPNNTNEVLIATETGIWSTDDITTGAAGDFWELTSTGLANVRCDMLQVRSSDKLVAVATHGRGVFTTNAFAAASASFSSSEEITYVNTNVTFTDLSAGATSWSWDFGAGASTATASTQGPHTISYSTPGVKTITLDINGGGGVLSTSKTITVLPNRTVPYLAADGGNFETNPNDFVAENVGGATNWERGNSAISGKNGVASGSNAWVTGISEALYSDNSHSNLYTPNFDFSSAGTYTLSFQTKHVYEADWDGMIVEYSTDKGSVWTKLGDGVTGAIWYNSTTAGPTDFGSTGTRIMSGTNANYATKSINVSSLAGNPDVAFRVVFRADGAEQDIGAAVDDFIIAYSSVSTPSVNLSVSSNTGSEAAATAITVTATASSAVTGDKTVDLNVTGTGITVGDYTLSNSTITILDGQTTGFVTFTVVDDALAETTETASLSISNPSSGIALGTTTTQDITITDNDDNDICTDAAIATCGNTYTGTTVGKGNDTPATCDTGSGTGGGVWYKIVGNNQRVTVSTCGGTTNFDTKLRVYSGSCAGLVCVTGNDDDCGTASTVNFDAFTGTDYYILVHGWDTSEGNYSMSVNCVPFPTVNLSVSSNTGSEAAASAITVTATASSAVTGDQTVNLAASGTGITAGDYSLSNTTITILDGQTTGTATFTVVDDALSEGTETATLTISNPSSRVTLGATTTQDIVITDNDLFPSVELSVDSNTGSEAAASVITVTAIASSAVTGTQTVNLAASGTGITAGDYTLSNSTITILDGQTTGTATFTVVDDALVEGTETATLTISSPSAGITLGATTTQDIAITDNDNYTIAITEFINNTTVNDATDEWIELYNYGANPIDIQNWRLKDEGIDNDIITASSYSIAAGEYLILAKDKSAFETQWLAGVVNSKVIEVTGLTLANGADEIVVTDNLDNVVWSLAFANDETDGRATFYSESTYTTNVWGNTTTPGVVRNGNDVTTGTLGYESNNNTTDVLARTSTTGDIGSPLNLPPPSPAFTSTISSVSCAGGTGAIDLTVTGGTGSATYLWNTGATTEDISGLAVGEYTVTISDGGTDYTARYFVGYDLNWTDLTNFTVNAEKELVKGATTGWDSDANSVERVIGDGGIVFTASETTNSYIVGLSYLNNTVGFSDIGYAIYLNRLGEVEVYQQGNYIGSHGNYVSGDIFRITRSGTTITYSKNGVPFRTQTNAKSTDLFVSATMFDASSSIPQVQFTSCPISLVVSTTSNSCPATTSGSAVASLVGEVLPVTYSWSGGGETTASITGKPNGTYTVTATIASAGLVLSKSVVIGNIITWENESNVSVVGNVVSKTDTQGWTSGANSTQQLSPTVDGWVNNTITSTSTSYMFGLAKSNTDANYTSITYAWYVTKNGIAYPNYNAQSGAGVAYQVGDNLRVGREGSQIKFYKNEVVVYQSAVVTGERLVADVSIYTLNGTAGVLQNSFCGTTGGETYSSVVTDFDCGSGSSLGSIDVTGTGFTYSWSAPGFSTVTTEDISNLPANGYTLTLSKGGIDYSSSYLVGASLSWTGLTDFTQEGLNLKKTSSSNGWSSSANSTVSFEGDGGIVFLAQPNSSYMIGVSKAEGGAGYTSIDYAIYLAASGSVSIYEKGVFKGNFGTYQANDVFKIERSGSSIHYSKNGSSFYTSSTPSNSSLLADVTMHTGSGVLPQVLFTDCPLSIDVTSSAASCPSAGVSATASLSGGNFATSYEWKDAANNTVSSSATLSPQTNGGYYTVTATGSYGTLTKTVFLSYQNTFVNQTEVSVSGSTVTKSTSAASWSAGATTSNTLAASSSGSILNTVAQKASYMFGLAIPNTIASYTSIKYAWYLSSSGVAYSGYNSTSGGSTTYQVGDKFSVARDGNMIKYFKNNVLIHQESAIMDALVGDVSIHTPNASAGSFVVSFCGSGARIPNKIQATTQLEKDTFSIYPNPSTGIFNVRFGTSLSADTQVTVFDGIGRSIKTQTFEKGSQKFTIDLKNQPKGIYLIHFNQNGNTYSKQIIVE
ncbi:T9SS type A sorting domain-containing protein [Bernardetia sp. OM2101]|uniref:T9SS type A sorting domain-containing protein n=1 Tax=Bernardetia sp. OM2101 TaxID=3344876 RepID=UPI0035D0F0E7